MTLYYNSIARVITRIKLTRFSFLSHSWPSNRLSRLVLDFSLTRNLAPTGQDFYLETYNSLRLTITCFDGMGKYHILTDRLGRGGGEGGGMGRDSGEAS